VSESILISKEILKSYYPYSKESWDRLVANMRATGTMKSFDAQTGESVDVNECIEINSSLSPIAKTGRT
jgi:hypothetical protein